MEKLPAHCRENAVLFKAKDYMNLDARSEGFRTSVRFNKVPDFYTIDDKDYYAAEMKIQGIKVGSAALASQDILNVKIQETEGCKQVRNLNFHIPPEADVKKASVEVFNGDTVFVRAPLKRRPL
ncbi:uncharacterized protein LOC105700394 [Orussus abietinus]|uniref:uncharacterized protein LOC105700394 n=1 Tax=Orussus abietinus TaxID=222816 RepID=UPI0006260CBD|nr:uncharacterized protein LOC105700394 [Orussus abietinus]